MNASESAVLPIAGSCGEGAKLHPCFDDAARHKFARLHLPVAPACNMQCNFCNRKYDCANESRPGVTSVLLTPQQASSYVDKAVIKVPRLSVIGIAGPGDPFANAAVTMETLRLVRERHEGLLLCVASNGLELTPHAAEMGRLKVSHVTVTVNAVNPFIGAQVYAWIRINGRAERGPDAAAYLWQRQQEAIQALKDAGITVKVNTVIIKGVNDEHVATIAQRVRELGADVLNPIPLYPAEGAVFTEAHAPDTRDLMRVKVLAGDHIPLMTHCARCRADAAGFLGRDDPGLAALLKETAAAGQASAPGPAVALTLEAAKAAEAVAKAAAELAPTPPPDPPLPRVRVAAASMEGLLVNDLLGKTRRFLIYEMNGTQAQLVGERPSPRAGAGGDRWAAMADVLSDCHTLLVGEAGGKPIQALGQHGIKVEVVEGLLQAVVPIALEGKDLGPYRRQAMACGGGCSCGAGGGGKKAKLKPEEGGASGPALKKGCQCGGGGGGCG
jgi:nitrogen fixation protein NifB